MQTCRIAASLLSLVGLVLTTGCGGGNVTTGNNKEIPAGRSPADEKRAENDLKMIGLAYHGHLDAKGKGPAKAEDLTPFLENDKRVVGLLENKDVVFLYGVRPIDMIDGSSNTIVAYEKDVPTKGGFILYGDAVVKKMTADEFKKAIIAKPKQ